MSISIDTIHITLPNQNLSTLKRKKGNVDLETGELIYSEGYFDCIRVRQYSEFIKIECSLPKLLKGENVFSLNYIEILKALDAISIELGICIKDGIISRIDPFTDINTHYPAKNYFRYLGISKHYKLRIIVAETSLYYKNKVSREMNFYDKIQEMMNRKLHIPILFNGKHITRIEARYKTFLKNICGRDMKVIDLYNPEIFIKIINRFIDDYRSIHKEQKPILDFSKASSKRNLLHQLANVGIQSLGGTTEVLEMMEASRGLNTSSVRPEYFSRRKADINEIASAPDFVKSVKLIEELNSKVELAYRNTVNNIKSINI